MTYKSQALSRAHSITLLSTYLPASSSDSTTALTYMTSAFSSEPNSFKSLMKDPSGIHVNCENVNAKPGVSLHIISGVGDGSDIRLPQGSYQLTVQPTEPGITMLPLSDSFKSLYHQTCLKHSEEHQESDVSNETRQLWAKQVAQLLNDERDIEGRSMYYIELLDYRTSSGTLERLVPNQVTGWSVESLVAATRQN